MPPTSRIAVEATAMHNCHCVLMSLPRIPSLFNLQEVVNHFARSSLFFYTEKHQGHLLCSAHLDKATEDIGFTGDGDELLIFVTLEWMSKPDERAKITEFR